MANQQNKITTLVVGLTALGDLDLAEEIGSLAFDNTRVLSLGASNGDDVEVSEELIAAYLKATTEYVNSCVEDGIEAIHVVSLPESPVDSTRFAQELSKLVGRDTTVKNIYEATAANLERFKAYLVSWVGLTPYDGPTKVDYVREETEFGEDFDSEFEGDLGGVLERLANNPLLAALMGINSELFTDLSEEGPEDFGEDITHGGEVPKPHEGNKPEGVVDINRRYMSVPLRAIKRVHFAEGEIFAEFFGEPDDIQTVSPENRETFYRLFGTVNFN